MVSARSLFTQANPVTLQGKILQFPLVRILLVALFIVPFLIFHNRFIADFIVSTEERIQSVLNSLDAVVSITVMILLYSFYTRVVEKRQAHEISLAKSLKEMSSGFFISFGLVGFMVLLMAVLGYYEVGHLNSSLSILEAIFFFGIGSFIQVLLFRLILFRLTEELMGTWMAFALVAAVFGIAHIANPNAGAGSTVALVLGDVLLAAAFIYTRRLWLVWGIHMGWNFFQDGIFGMPNSGITELVSWIQPDISGPNWITGGNFGIELSYIALLLSLVFGIIIFKKAIEKRQIVPPVWKRDYGN